MFSKKNLLIYKNINEIFLKIKNKRKTDLNLVYDSMFYIIK